VAWDGSNGNSRDDLHKRNGALIQIDIEQRPTNPRVDRFIHGESKTVATSLLDIIPAAPSARDRWDGMAPEARTSLLTYSREAGTGQASDGRLDPRTAMSRLNEILPRNRQVVTDGGHFIGWPSYYLELPAPDSLTMVGTHFQSIGLGFPSAPGAVLARP